MVQDCEHKGPHLGLRQTLRPAVGKRCSDQKADFADVIDQCFAGQLTHFLLLSGCLPLMKCFSAKITKKIHNTLTNEQSILLVFVFVVMPAFALILVIRSLQLAAFNV